MPAVNSDPDKVAAPPADAQETTAESAIHNASDVRVLVIDDDPSVGRLIQAALTGHEFRIDVISDCQLVIPTLRKEQFHVVILDYVLPGLESAEVLNVLQETQPEANVIVVTAFPSMDGALECLRARACDYLTKPFPIEQMKKTVMRCLESRGLLRLSEEALREMLGLTIRDRRKALGLTLADMSKRTNVSLGYLSQIELGKNSASIETLYRIALGLRVRVSDLFQGLQTTL